MCRDYLMVIDLWRKDYRLCLQSSSVGTRSRVPARACGPGGSCPRAVGPGPDCRRRCCQEGRVSKHAAVVLSTVTDFKENRDVFFD